MVIYYPVTTCPLKGLLFCRGQQKTNKRNLDFVEEAQAAQTLFVIYIRDSIALRFEPFKRMYENGSKIALNSTCSKGFK